MLKIWWRLVQYFLPRYADFLPYHFKNSWSYYNFNPAIHVLLHLLTTSLRKGCKVLQWVCLFVCLPTYLKNYIAELHQIFRACFLLPWLGPAMTASIEIRYVLPVLWITSCFQFFHTLALWCVMHHTNERPNVTLFATDVVAKLGTEPARLPVLQVGGHSSLSNSWDTYSRMCRLCTQSVGCAWRDMQMDVSCRWGFGRPGIGWYS